MNSPLRAHLHVVELELRRVQHDLVRRPENADVDRDVAGEYLVGYGRAREFRAAQRVQSAEETLRLTQVRYRGGASSFLDVLDSDTRLFSAQLDLVQAQLTELTAFVEVYRALGGGWQESR